MGEISEDWIEVEKRNIKEKISRDSRYVILMFNLCIDIYLELYIMYSGSILKIFEVDCDARILG